jgi:hypothetical protein
MLFWSFSPYKYVSKQLSAMPEDGSKRQLLSPTLLHLAIS